MPFIETKTNTAILPEKELVIKAKMAKAIELIPGKSEAYLMLNFADGQRMWFKGSNEPCAMLEVKIFGGASQKSYDALTNELTKIISEELGIPSGRIYVKYDEVENWGLAGTNF